MKSRKSLYHRRRFPSEVICHSEQEIGSLEPGKLADLVVLEEDPRTVESTAISDIRISETWMDGRRVFQG